MKAFLDNTGVHRIYKILTSYKKSSPIRIIDAIALLNFAEHILFSESMYVSSFERDDTREITNKTIDLLKNYGFILDQNNRLLLDIIKFSENDYAKACLKAIPKIQEDFQLLNITTIKNLSKLADEATKPLTIKDSELVKWITSYWNKNERNEIKIKPSSTINKGGSIDFIMASSEVMNEQLKYITRNLKNNKDLKKIAHLFDIFFRIEINEELAKINKNVYTPAPQRARAVNQADHMFRYELSNKILNYAKKLKGNFPSNLLNHIVSEDILPFPIFAIHYLRKEKIKSPIGILESAIKIRNNTEIKKLRSWLIKWEILYSSIDENKKLKAINELKNIMHELKISQKPFKIYSIFRPVITIDQYNSSLVEFDFIDPSKMEIIFAKLKSKFSWRKLFLSTLIKELSVDKQIGSDINKMIDRALIE